MPKMTKSRIIVNAQNLLDVASNMNDQKCKIILNTKRLILRTWKAEDTTRLAEISSDPVVMEYFPELQNKKCIKNLVDHINRQFTEEGFTLYAVEFNETGEFIGFTGLNKPGFDNPKINKNNPLCKHMLYRLYKG